jgi:hypothetical protein
VSWNSGTEHSCSFKHSQQQVLNVTFELESHTDDGHENVNWIKLAEDYG